MERRRSFAIGALLDLAAVAVMAVLGGYIFQDRVPAASAGAYVSLSAGFVLASLAGSYLAWHLRLERPFGTASGLVVAAAFGVIGGALAFLPIAFAERWGLWVFCVWAALGSYAFGFMWFNGRGHVRNAG
jgi:hypothetical protein